MNTLTIVKSCSAALGAFLGALLGGVDGFLYTLIVLVVADYLTGVLAAIHEKRLSSEVGFTGIAKKILIFVIIVEANIIDVYLIKTGSILRTAAIFFYIANEGISILENAAVVGLPIPAKLRETLEQIQTESENKNGNK